MFSQLAKRSVLDIGRGGGGTPYNGLYGGAPPERDTFLRLKVYKKSRDFTS